jgi:hypothetical protein
MILAHHVHTTLLQAHLSCLTRSVQDRVNVPSLGEAQIRLIARGSEWLAPACRKCGRGMVAFKLGHASNHAKVYQLPGRVRSMSNLLAGNIRQSEFRGLRDSVRYHPGTYIDQPYDPSFLRRERFLFSFVISTTTRAIRSVRNYLRLFSSRRLSKVRFGLIIFPSQLTSSHTPSPKIPFQSLNSHIHYPPLCT